MPKNQKRRAIRLTLPPDLIAEAREAGLNVSQVAETALRREVAKRRNQKP